MFLWILGFTSFMVPVIISALIWLRYRLTAFPDPNNVENRANLSAGEVQLPLKYCCLNILLNTNAFQHIHLKDEVEEAHFESGTCHKSTDIWHLLQSGSVNAFGCSSC